MNFVHTPAAITTWSAINCELPAVTFQYGLAVISVKRLCSSAFNDIYVLRSEVCDEAPCQSRRLYVPLFASE
jgi:hypothetical protein